MADRRYPIVVPGPRCSRWDTTIPLDDRRQRMGLGH